ncbi:MAG: NAD(P)-dependent oxidoreductase [Roseiflexaceae bacterium]
MLNIALLGLGIMGNGMAHNLLKAGFPLTIYNRTRAKAEPLGALGATVAASPREAAAGADIVIAMVGDDRASRAIWLGEDGALAVASAKAVLIECSTLSLEWVRELAERCAALGLDFLDAPVTGSKEAAEAGELKLMIGGDAVALERARPALEAISAQIIHFGPSGAGALIKLINNLMAATQVAVLAEGLNLAEQGGLDLAQVIPFLINAAPGSPVVKGKAQLMAARNYDAQFALKWMHKDTTYALRAADEFGVPMPTLAAAREVYQLAKGLGYGENDFAAVFEALRQVTGQTEPPI